MLRKLEKYEIEEEIGHGGMATVYRAHDTVLDRRVALKVMHPHLRGAEEARARFHREARSVARLRHPRVLEIYDFSGEGSEEAYIAAELLTGPTLKRWREDTREVPAEIAACMAIEITRALESAHDAGIVHRDVKPENVLLHESRTLKLTDFGIADMMDAASMTATGQILGSPGHMAPEQIEGRDTDQRTDLFSLGTVLYYLATGRLPFTGRNPHQVLKRIMDGEYADPLRVTPTLGGRLRSIIVRSLETDPEQRFQSAAEFREALEAFVAEAGIDDSFAELQRYLKNPDEVGPELRARAVPALIRRGTTASDEGDVPAALDYYNRVLALDDGNEKVMRLIERVGLDRRRRALMFSGVGLIAFGLTASGAAWALWPEPAGPETPVVPPLGAAVDGGAPLEDSGPEAGDAGEALAERPDSGSAPDAAVEQVDAGPRSFGRNPRPPTPASSGPRRVEFHARPAAVAIGVDGAEPRPVGSSFSGAELEPGRHSFRVVPLQAAAETWREQTFALVIPPGDEPFRLPLALPYASAAIQVRANVPGEVDVGGRASGRIGALITVEMHGARENFAIRVTAPGHEPQTARVQLVAGRTADAIEVTLPETPAP